MGRRSAPRDAGVRGGPLASGGLDPLRKHIQKAFGPLAESRSLKAEHNQDLSYSFQNINEQAMVDEHHWWQLLVGRRRTDSI